MARRGARGRTIDRSERYNVFHRAYQRTEANQIKSNIEMEAPGRWRRLVAHTGIAIMGPLLARGPLEAEPNCNKNHPETLFPLAMVSEQQQLNSTSDNGQNGRPKLAPASRVQSDRNFVTKALEEKGIVL